MWLLPIERGSGTARGMADGRRLSLGLHGKAGGSLQELLFCFSLNWMWLVSGKHGFKRELRGKTTALLGNVQACLGFWTGILVTVLVSLYQAWYTRSVHCTCLQGSVCTWWSSLHQHSCTAQGSWSLAFHCFTWLNFVWLWQEHFLLLDKTGGKLPLLPFSGVS